MVTLTSLMIHDMLKKIVLDIDPAIELSSEDTTHLSFKTPDDEKYIQMIRGAIWKCEETHMFIVNIDITK